MHSLAEALTFARNDPEVFIIGGAEIYLATLELADRIYLTVVHAHIKGDTYFPGFEGQQWQETSRERHEANGKNPYAYSFVIYERKRQS